MTSACLAFGLVAKACNHSREVETGFPQAQGWPETHSERDPREWREVKGFPITGPFWVCSERLEHICPKRSV